MQKSCNEGSSLSGAIHAEGPGLCRRTRALLKGQDNAEGNTRGGHAVMVIRVVAMLLW